MDKPHNAPGVLEAIPSPPPTSGVLVNRLKAFVATPPPEPVQSVTIDAPLPLEEAFQAVPDNAFAVGYEVTLCPSDTDSN